MIKFSVPSFPVGLLAHPSWEFVFHSYSSVACAAAKRIRVVGIDEGLSFVNYILDTPSLVSRAQWNLNIQKKLK